MSPVIIGALIIAFGIWAGLESIAKSIRSVRSIRVETDIIQVIHEEASGKLPRL